MENNLNFIKNNIEKIFQLISDIKRINNITYNIELVAVSKTFSVDYIIEAYKNGIKCFGENRVQEAIEKIEKINEIYENIKDISWHMIGTLQTNKVKKAIEYFEFIQSVDRESLVDEIARRSNFINNKIINILFEVNISEEIQKSGVSPDKLFSLIDYTFKKDIKNVRIKGLMSVGLLTEDKVIKEKEFEKMRDLFEKAQSYYGKEYFSILSMGMSDDFLLAIKHGANMIRIGSAIFGRRKY
ncbi:MAG: YggS family pyridoxal phosphate-dependent enzyme [Spirochaetes bacterium]|nr:YggS family pyridoxal phosphate-dependent enzyme [Spirochaetota bacterium]